MDIETEVRSRVSLNVLTVFYYIYGIAIILLYAFFSLPILYGLLTIISAVCMQKRRWRVFSFIVAVGNIPSYPLGTILSIFTFIVLANKGVGELYKKQYKNKQEN